MRVKSTGLALPVLILLLAVAVIAAASCGVRDDDSTPRTATSATTLAPSTTVVPSGEKISVYYSCDELVCARLRIIPAGDDALAAAVRALLAGPTTDELADGVASSIPEGTTLLDVETTAGVATLDLSPEFAAGGGSLSMIMRLVEVVFTATQFLDVSGVELELAGEPVEEFGPEGLILARPMTRADFERLSPAILVESPLPGETVSSPARIQGTSNTFEATCIVKILDEGGAELVSEVVTATSGTGQRGTFEVSLPFTLDTAGPGTIVAYEESAEDGSPINRVEIPVQLVP